MRVATHVRALRCKLAASCPDITRRLCPPAAALAVAATTRPSQVLCGEVRRGDLRRHVERLTRSESWPRPGREPEAVSPSTLRRSAACLADTAPYSRRVGFAAAASVRHCARMSAADSEDWGGAAGLARVRRAACNRRCCSVAVAAESASWPHIGRMSCANGPVRACACSLAATGERSGPGPTCRPAAAAACSAALTGGLFDALRQRRGPSVWLA
jgi:hypothetical protein